MSGLVRTGRGGAGNFISPKDVEQVEKAQHANVRYRAIPPFPPPTNTFPLPRF